MVMICARKCFHENRLYEVGDQYQGSGDPPEHFVPEDQYSGELDPVVTPVFTQARVQRDTVSLHEASVIGGDKAAGKKPAGKGKAPAEQ